MHADQIRQLIETGLKGSKAIVSGEDGVHFQATVISPDFNGKNRVQKQKMIYATLGSYLQDGSLHALSLTALTPEEWQDNTHG